MSGIEQDHRFNEVVDFSAEQQLIPIWEPMHNGSSHFPPGSIGAEVFPEALEGRERPFNSFGAQRVSKLSLGGPTLRCLWESHIMTLADILGYPSASISEILREKERSHRLSDEVRNSVAKTLLDLTISPHQKLLRSLIAYREKLHIIPVSQEETVRDLVSKAMQWAMQRRPGLETNMQIVTDLFGLHDGIERDKEEVARMLRARGKNVTGERVRQIAVKAKKSLLHADAGLKNRHDLLLSNETSGT